MKRIAQFGATGGTGRQFIRQACAAGHEVTAVVRDPDRLTESHPRLRVVQADVTDPTAIGPAVAGCDAVVSAIGSRDGRAPTTVCVDSAVGIIAAMRGAAVRRLVVVSAGTVTTDGDGPLMRLVMKPLVGKLLEHAIADKLRMEEVVRASGLDWTIVRPPMLTDGPHTGAYRSAIDHNVRGALRVSRADVAHCILRCLTDYAPIEAALSIGSRPRAGEGTEPDRDPLEPLRLSCPEFRRVRWSCFRRTAGSAPGRCRSEEHPDEGRAAATAAALAPGASRVPEQSCRRRTAQRGGALSASRAPAPRG
ncbi:SDR family oxidoreductase [Streptomyces sp. ME03-5709C]|nr:SDR family oxidoreductase [Streptomyces sp. ME03-5709C]